MTNDQTVTQALEPCPAGHDCAKLDYDDEFETFFVRCEEPDCSWQAWGDTEAEAITAWNTRTAHSGEGRCNGAGEDRSFQVRVHEWMLECFGPEIEADRQERADRFIEEALELAQTMPGFNAGRAHALVDYVFGRPVGERHQEVGGVMVTLAALCNTVGLRIDEEAERELARVWTKVEAIRAKQAAKPTGSALPVALSTPQGEVERLGDISLLLSRMKCRIADWDEEEPRDDWWQYQREYFDAYSLLSALAQPEAGGEHE